MTKEEDVRFRTAWWDIRGLRRLVAAVMYPRQKRLATLSALGLVSLALYSMSVLLPVTLGLVVCCIVGYRYIRKRLPARSGLNPRAGLKVPFELPRWLWGVSGVSVAQQRRLKSSGNKSEFRVSERISRGQFGGTGIYRKEAETNSLLFSPRDFLMGSYIGKPESPTSACGRRTAGRNPREQLREKLSRPNHAVYTPNRRLSFAGYVYILNTQPLPTTCARGLRRSFPCDEWNSSCWRVLMVNCEAGSTSISAID